LVDVGDAELDRLQILVGEFDARERALQQGALLHGTAAAAVGEALPAFEHLGQFVWIGPGAAVHQLVDVGSVSSFRIGEDPQGGGVHVAVVRRHVGQAVLTNEIHVACLVGIARQPGGLGNHAGLERQQVAEDAGKGDHHVDPRPPQFLDRDQLRAAQPAIAVEARAGTDQRQRLSDLRALALQIVGAPQHHGEAFREGAAGRQMPLDQSIGTGAALRNREGAGDFKGIEAVDVAAGRQHVRIVEDVAAGRGRDVAAVQGVDDRAKLVIGVETLGDRLAILLRQGGEELRRGLRAQRCAEHVEAAGDQGLFELV
jgi:hypothetical protein